VIGDVGAAVQCLGPHPVGVRGVHPRRPDRHHPHQTRRTRQKVPGVIGDIPLHRLHSSYDTNNDIRASRRRVPKTCRLYWGPKYTANKTKQCDEYPFATTYENSARVDATTSYDYAVRPIKKEHNETAGFPYGAWLGADRILDGDPFFVRIVP
jgi:hypothetical protein